ncbi:MAG: pilin [Patescibacteria group bacterium]
MKKFLFFFTLIIITLFSVSPVLAESPQEPSQSEAVGGPGDFRSGLDSQTDALLGSSGIDATISADRVVASVINLALSMLAILFVILIIISGYQWMTAGGNEEQVKKAQSRMKNAIIGLVIVILAYAITAFVFQNLPGGGGVNDPGTSGTSG